MEHTNVSEAGDILETEYVRDGDERVRLIKAAVKVAVREVQCAVLRDATERLCFYCRGGQGYFYATPEKSGHEWVHRPKVDNPLWTGVTCCAGALHDMMEELR